MNADRDIRDKNLNIHLFESKAPAKLCAKWICVNGSYNFHAAQTFAIAWPREILKGGLDGKV